MKHVLDINSEKPVRERIDNQEGELKVEDDAYKGDKVVSLLLFIKHLTNNCNAIMEKINCTQNK